MRRVVFGVSYLHHLPSRHTCYTCCTWPFLARIFWFVHVYINCFSVVCDKLVNRLLSCTRSWSVANLFLTIWLINKSNMLFCHFLVCFQVVLSILKSERGLKCSFKYIWMCLIYRQFVVFPQRFQDMLNNSSVSVVGFGKFYGLRLCLYEDTRKRKHCRFLIHSSSLILQPERYRGCPPLKSIPFGQQFLSVSFCCSDIREA